MPTTVQAALLGVVQGLTEFLPVSSSAHLILARAFFGWDSDQFGLAFDVACHVGTLIAVVIYFRREIAAMVASLPRLFDPVTDQDAHLIWLLAVAAILGAGASEAPKLLKAGIGAYGAMLFLIGIVSSAIVGYIAVKWFIRYLANHSLDVFAWYRLALAAAVAVWILRG